MISGTVNEQSYDFAALKPIEGQDEYFQVALHFCISVVGLHRSLRKVISSEFVHSLLQDFSTARVLQHFGDRDDSAEWSASHLPIFTALKGLNYFIIELREKLAKDPPVGTWDGLHRLASGQVSISHSSACWETSHFGYEDLSDYE